MLGLGSKQKRSSGVNERRSDTYDNVLSSVGIRGILWEIRSGILWRIWWDILWGNAVELISIDCSKRERKTEVIHARNSTSRKFTLRVLLLVGDSTREDNS